MKDISYLTFFQKVKLYFICLWSEHKSLQMLVTNEYDTSEDYKSLAHLLWVQRQEKKEIIKSILNQK